MKNFKIWIYKHIVRRFLPMQYQVNFSTNDDIVTSTYAIAGGSVKFYWLPKPMKRSEAEGKTVNQLKCKGCVSVNFYKPESIDKFIEHLQEVKQNIQLRLAAEILDNGGTMEFVWDKKVDDAVGDYARYTGHIEFKKPNSEQKAQ